MAKILKIIEPAIERIFPLNVILCTMYIVVATSIDFDNDKIDEL